MRVAFSTLMLVLLFLQPIAHAEEKEQVRVVTGKLVAYGFAVVEADGEEIDLCNQYEVLDTLDRPISLDGLVATEIVTVTVLNSCAIQVKAEKIRR